MKHVSSWNLLPHPPSIGPADTLKSHELADFDSSSNAGTCNNFLAPEMANCLLFRTPDYHLPPFKRYGNTPRRTACFLCCLVCGLMLSEVGCLSGGTTRKASSAKFAKHVTSSVPELSSRNRSLLAIYSAEVETAADEIILKSPSPATRRQALAWKAEAIPVLQTSLLNTDPVAAVLDTWTFPFPDERVYAGTIGEIRARGILSRCRRDDLEHECRDGTGSSRGRAKCRYR